MITPEKLKEIRFKNNDMSQDEMAAKLGVSKQYISDLERGKKPISLNFKKKLIEAGLFEEAAKSQFQKELNLTESEFQELIKFIEEDKYTLFLFIKARNGDKTALDALKKLLSI